MEETFNRTQENIEQLLKIGAALSAEKDLNILLKQLLDSALQLSNADAGTIFFVTEEKTLSFAIRSRQDELPAFELPMFDPETGEPNTQFVSVYSAVSGQTVKIDDIYSAPGDPRFNLEGTRQFDKETGYFTRSMISVPMIFQEDHVVGVMQIVNAKDRDNGELVPFCENDIGLLESLASQAAVAVENQRLFKSQQNLMDSFIKIIAGAIDAKSPYTGGHCSRVPEIANMLAKACTKQQDGPLKDYKMNKEEWREFHIAGWLHDCGKVTTPEFVVDKDTKLSTIYNRIHEIRMRFEVLRRDAEIAHLKAVIENPQNKQALEAELAKHYAELEEEYEFIAECNVGSEFLSDEAIERMNQIGERRWIRNFSDRVGLSNLDNMNYKHIPVNPAPYEEKLLDDKPEHIIQHPHLSEDHSTELKTVMQRPENLFNRGERYNLSIRRGTLTSEERYIINDHIVQTIIMLRKLPLPDSLSRVPEIAGGHHETMIGTGYPLGLKKDQLSVSARIMAIADIFEALTACDRPYKKAKTMSEALQIMSFMVKDQHIDKDLFELFLRSGIHETYAEKFLHNPDLSEINIEDYLG